MTGVLFPRRVLDPAPRPVPAAGPAVVVGLTPERLLRAADDLLSGVVTIPDAEPVWSLACVYLLRASLEAELRALWARTIPEAAAASGRAQLLVLPQVVDADTASAVAELWGALSEATHQRAYALPPTVNEVASWSRAVRSACADLARAQGSCRPRR